MASSSKATSRRPKTESKESKSTTKAKGKGKKEAKTKTKAKAAAAMVAEAEEEGEDVEMHDGVQAAAAEDSGPAAAVEDNDSGEDELEDAEERKAASKRCVCVQSHLPARFMHLLADANTKLSLQCTSSVGSERRDGCRGLESRRSVCPSLLCY